LVEDDIDQRGDDDSGEANHGHEKPAAPLRRKQGLRAFLRWELPEPGDAPAVKKPRLARLHAGKIRSPYAVAAFVRSDKACWPRGQ